jgi:Rrf2 family protein
MSANNQRFSVSVHILTILAASYDAPVTSEAIATSVDTNPVVIRRTMSRLRTSGLVDSRPGACGGWKLAKHPQQISLCEVFHAVSSEDVLAIHEHPNADCQIGGKIKKSLGKVFDRAQQSLEATLDQFTIADVLEDVMILQNAETE